jgi:hypothetical protein
MARRRAAGLQSAYKSPTATVPGAKMGHEVGMAEFDPAADTMFSPGSMPASAWDPPLSRTEAVLRAILLISFGAVLALEAYLIWQVVRLIG